MRFRSACLALLLSVIVACGSSGSGDATLAHIEGRVVAGPVCPVVTKGTPCPDTPWQGQVRATAQDGSVVDGTTGEDGRFRLEVPGGTYEVVAEPIEGIARGIPETVHVVAAATVRVTLHVDTGIR
jgi:hypothetical protein